MRAIRTVLTIALSLVMFSAIAQAGTKTSDKKDRDKNKEHSRISKVAFWRHHKNANKAKPAHASQASSNHGPSKPAQVKPVSKQGNSNKQLKPAQHTTQSKASVNKVPTVSKKKAQPKAEDTKKAS